jgi:hypothetical protein
MNLSNKRLGTDHLWALLQAKETAMSSKSIPIPQSSKSTASYFGLPVTVLLRLTRCTLIGFGDREFIVDTGDLKRMEKVKLAK